MLCTSETRRPRASAASPAVRSPRYFIPIRLNPHTAYRTQQDLRNLLGQHRLWDSAHLIVLAVHPRVPQLAWQSADLAYLLRGMTERTTMREHGHLLSWQAIAASEGFIAFSARLLQACLANPAFLEVLEQVSLRRATGAGTSLPADRRRQAAIGYVRGELAISVYCTEVLGYWDEVWEKPPPRGAIEPLAALYQDFPYIVMSVCGAVRTKRRLSFIAERACAAG